MTIGIIPIHDNQLSATQLFYQIINRLISTFVTIVYNIHGQCIN